MNPKSVVMKVGAARFELATLAPEAPRSSRSMMKNQLRTFFSYLPVGAARFELATLAPEAPRSRRSMMKNQLRAFFLTYLSGRRDSNSRPLGPEPSALAGLSHAPKKSFYASLLYLILTSYCFSSIPIRLHVYQLPRNTTFRRSCFSSVMTYYPVVHILCMTYVIFTMQRTS